jgi:DNA polymerase III delta prime subunit
MRRRTMGLTRIVIGVLAAAAFTIATEIAVQDLPAIIEERRGLAWPAFIMLVLLLILLEVWNRYGEQNTVRSVPETSAADPLFVATTSTAERDAENRRTMIQRVRSFWIEGVLEKDLYQIARIELQLEARPGAVRQPWDIIVQRPDRQPYSLAPGTQIREVFDEAGRALLILGDPGSGKTTTLLELAKELLDQADQDPSHPVPVVFHLSSWAIARQSLVDWMVEELRERYYVPATIGRTWIRNQQILPLLDGLDEVVPEHRTKCVAAISRFRENYGLLPIVVCCRVNEYEALRRAEGLSGELPVAQAIFLEPLTYKQVVRYLRGAGKPLAGVRAALRDDSTLWELLNTPLLLSIMALTYGNKSAAEVRRLGPPEERRDRLFRAYTHSMFERRGKDSRYRRRESVRWLKWLGRTLSTNQQTLLRLEWMQPDWLSGPKQRWAVTGGVAVVVGLATSGIIGLTAWLFYQEIVPDPFDRLIAAAFGLVAGASCGVASYDRHIRPAEGLDWSLSTIRDWMLEGILSWLYRGLVLGLLLGLVPMLLGFTVGLPRLGAGLWSGAIAMLACLVLGLAIGLNIGLTAGLFEWLAIQRDKSSIVPKEDVPSATRNVLAGGLVSTIFWGFMYAYTLGVLFSFLDRQDLGVWAGILLGVTLGLVVALRTGGGAYLQHRALLTVLYLKDFAPWRYAEFLDNAAERLFLRKVGRGYIFVHRLLLEHFATSEQPDEFREEYTPPKAKAARPRQRRSQGDSQASGATEFRAASQARMGSAHRLGLWWNRTSALDWRVDLRWRGLDG